MKEDCGYGKKVWGEGFQDMDPGEIQEQTDTIPYRNIFREMKKQKAEITMCFYKVTPVCLPLLPPFHLLHLFWPLPSLRKHTQPPLLSLPPPPSIQHEDNKAEDLYDDDPLPLHEE